MYAHTRSPMRKEAGEDTNNNIIYSVVLRFLSSLPQEVLLVHAGRVVHVGVHLPHVVEVLIDVREKGQ